MNLVNNHQISSKYNKKAQPDMQAGLLLETMLLCFIHILRTSQDSPPPLLKFGVMRLRGKPR